MTVMSDARRWWAVGGWVAALALLGACNSGQPPLPLSPAAPSEVASPEAQASGSTAAAAEEFCKAIKAEFELVPQLLDAETQRDSARRQTLLAQAKEANDKIIATAPAEQKRDVGIVIGASNAANTALTANGTIPSSVMKQFESPEYRAASTRVREYVQQQCNIDPMPASGPAQRTAPSPRN